MDLNLVVLDGRLSAPLELVNTDAGNRIARLLVAVRSETPVKRLDLVPVIWWDPGDEDLATVSEVGGRVWVSGSVQRRYWEGVDGRRSRLEIVAHQITFPSDSQTWESEPELLMDRG